MKGEQRFCWFCGRAFVVTTTGNQRFCSARHAAIERLTIKRLELGVQLLEQTNGRSAERWDEAA